ncbi:hypothetical protein T492DRAFT_841105 [Pavlovales sp. CCMP2436]|nr:hypothetical protein T492DRAFT_841105 [Pavlovales sp. CCMP2436]
MDSRGGAGDEGRARRAIWPPPGLRLRRAQNAQKASSSTMTRSVGKTSAARPARESSPSWTTPRVLVPKGERTERRGPLQDCAFGASSRALCFGAVGRPRQPGPPGTHRRHGPPRGCWCRRARSESDAAPSRRAFMADPDRPESVVESADRVLDVAGARPPDVRSGKPVRFDGHVPLATTATEGARGGGPPTKVWSTPPPPHRIAELARHAANMAALRFAFYGTLRAVASAAPPVRGVATRTRLPALVHARRLSSERAHGALVHPAGGADQRAPRAYNPPPALCDAAVTLARIDQLYTQAPGGEVRLAVNAFVQALRTKPGPQPDGELVEALLALCALSLRIDPDGCPLQEVIALADELLASRARMMSPQHVVRLVEAQAKFAFYGVSTTDVATRRMRNAMHNQPGEVVRAMGALLPYMGTMAARPIFDAVVSIFSENANANGPIRRMRANELGQLARLLVIYRDNITLGGQMGTRHMATRGLEQVFELALRPLFTEKIISLTLTGEPPPVTFLYLTQ